MEEGGRAWMEGIMVEVKKKMGHEVEACQGDIPDALINNLVATMANEIEKEEGLIMETETMDMTTYNSNLPKIPDEILATVESDAEDVCIWAKPQPGGFLVGDDTHPVISGIITNVDPYHVKWVDNQPDKLQVPAGQDPPEDYEPRCDVRILTPEGIEIGVSLAKSSYLYSFAPYIKGLKGMGLQPTDVVTRFTCREVNGQYGTFTTVRMSMVSKKDNAIPVEELPPTEFDSKGDRIPY